MAAPPGRKLPEDVEVDADAPFSFEEEDDNTVLAPLHSTSLGILEVAQQQPGASRRHSEWTKLAQLVLVQVHGSCKDERMFSAMSHLKTSTPTSLMSHI